MKKYFLAIFSSLFAFSVVAQEQVLFDYSAKADVLNTGYDWVENAKTVAYSGIYIPGKNISNPIISEKYGLAVRTDIAPREDSNFAIRFITPTFNDGEGVGIIKNAGSIKSMNIVLTLNRGYDEVTVVWEQNGKEHSKKFTTKNTTEPVSSMYEFTAHIDFSDYIEDVRNRNTKNIPIAGLNTTSILLKEIKVTTHAPSSDWAYSPTCIVGVKRISVVCDKAVDDAIFERGREADTEFNIHSASNLENKVRAEIESEIQRNNYAAGLMVDNQEKTTSESDAK